MLKLLLLILAFIGGIYIPALLVMYGFQERLLFHPNRLTRAHIFSFKRPFEERWVESDGVKLNVLRFTHPNPEGAILYFHGNAGALDSWGQVSADFDHVPYELWIYDYRGYGKSEGKINSEAELHQDAEAVYKEMQRHQKGVDVILYGRSLGTGIAAQLAIKHSPRLLILESPYWSMTDLAHHHYPFVPSLLLKYPLRTDLMLPKVRSPIALLHGENDQLIPFSSSSRLSKIGENITLYPFPMADHNSVSQFAEYRVLMKRLLAQ